MQESREEERSGDEEDEEDDEDVLRVGSSAAAAAHFSGELNLALTFWLTRLTCVAQDRKR